MTDPFNPQFSQSPSDQNGAAQPGFYAESQPAPEARSPDEKIENLGHSEAFWDIFDSMDVSDIQMRAIEFTVRGLPDVTIANTLSIDRKTLWRWKTFDERYQNALEYARSQIYSNANDRYQNLLLRATIVIAQCLEDATENNRLRAAQTIMRLVGKFRPQCDSKTIEQNRPRIPEPSLPYKMG
jgi:hypothetical protein